MDRITITFYDSDQVKLAGMFRQIAGKQGYTLNKLLIKLIGEYNEKHKHLA